jgi:hypothetical protein
MLRIPGTEIDLLEETFQRRFVSQQLSEQPARIPRNEDVADVKDNRINSWHRVTE